jgi:hypothetical protein
LEWELQWGKELDFLQEVWREMGVMPPALASRPKLPSKYRWVLLTFYDISGGRGYGMAGPQPLQAAEVLAYCQLHGITGVEARERIFRFMRILDPVYLTVAHKQMEQLSK